MAPTYATPGELADELGKTDPPDNAERLLKRASRLVDMLLYTAVYPVDDEGMPTGHTVRDTLREATLTQAAYYAEHGEPGTGEAIEWTNVMIGNVQLQGRDNSPSAGEIDGQTIAPGVDTTLRLAGLIPSAPYIVG